MQGSIKSIEWELGTVESFAPTVHFLFNKFVLKFTIHSKKMLSSKKRKVLKLILFKKLNEKKKPKFWVHPLHQKRHIDGEHKKLDTMFAKFPKKFASYTRMSPNTFEKLFSLVGSSLKKGDTNYRKAIPARHRLYIILR